MIKIIIWGIIRKEAFIMIGSYLFNTDDIKYNKEDNAFENIRLNTKVKIDYRNKMDGVELLSTIPAETVTTAFFDPQYRGILDKLNYGNETTGKGKKRAALQQMPEEVIVNFISQINRSLKPSGHLFLWIDKFHLCEGFLSWLSNTDLVVVDMITWDKDKFGLGYRSRRQSEYCVVLQKKPTKAKGVWTIHNIPDVWKEKIVKTKEDNHPHLKPLELQEQLILATSNPGDFILDPASGSYSVMKVAVKNRRQFIGGDIEYGEDPR